MSILIKGMEMPTDCAMLLKIFPDGRIGVPIHLNWMGTMVVNDADAVPVPPHGRLIDADAFESIKYELPDGQKSFNRGFHSGVQYVQRLIMDAPAIIPAEEGET